MLSGGHCPKFFKHIISFYLHSNSTSSNYFNSISSLPSRGTSPHPILLIWGTESGQTTEKKDEVIMHLTLSGKIWVDITVQAPAGSSQEKNPLTGLGLPFNEDTRPTCLGCGSVPFYQRKTVLEVKKPPAFSVSKLILLEVGSRSKTPKWRRGSPQS